MSQTIPDQNNPRVSVVMSVYNGEAYLKQAVDSILEQSFRNLEFIVVDDASQDHSVQILNDIAVHDNRLLVLRNEVNLGLTRSLNRGLAAARGQYFARMDADDLSLPERLASQVEFLDRYPEIGIVGSGARLIEENGNIIKEIIPPTGNEEIQAELLIKNHFGHPEIMARTSVLREIGGYDENLRYAQDYELWSRLKTVTRFAALPEVLYVWRNRRSNITNSQRSEQLESAFRTSLKLVQQALPDAELLDIDSYRRVWFAYHGYTGIYSSGDIFRLEPLWVLLESKARLLSRTVLGFGELALNLIRKRHYRDGYLLCRIVRRHLNGNISPQIMLKYLTLSMLET